MSIGNFSKPERRELGSIGTLWFKGQPFKKTDIVETGKYPCLHYGELFSKYGAIIDSVSSRCYVPPKRLSQKGDILFPASDVTPAGLTRCSAIMQEDVILGGDVIGFRPQTGLNPIYLSYAIRHQKDQLLQRVTGALIKHISAKSLQSVIIPIHPIESQNRFEKQVRHLNRIISHRRTQLAKLDELVKCRFVEMFKHADFPKEVLSSNVTEMFIGPFGSSLKNECFVSQDEAYCVVYEQKHAILKSIEMQFRYVNYDKYNELKRFTILPGDLIMSCRGTIGEMFIVPPNAPLGIMHPSIMKIRLNEKSYDSMFFFYLLSDFMEKNMDKSNGGVVKMAITAKSLGNTYFSKPPLELQQTFSSFVRRIDKLRFDIQKSLNETQKLFDSLMQEYFD